MSGGFPLAVELCNGNDIGTVTASSGGTAITGGASNVKGSYTQLTASSPIDICALGICLQETSNTTRHCFVDIAIGGAGSEQVIISNLMVEGSTNGQTGTDYLFPITIKSGTRLSARAQNGSATADGPTVNLIGYDGSYDAEGFAGVDDIGSVTGTTFGTLLTASATANTKGTYSQLVASTTRDYAGFWIRPSAPSSGTGIIKGLMDIAIGGSGSETVIIPNIQISALNVPPLPHFLGPFWIPIPSGTRMAARVQAATGSGTIGLQLHGIYK